MGSLLPKKICCTKLFTDWVKRPVEEIVCSMQPVEKICGVEIKLFRATVFSRCMQQALGELNGYIAASPDKKNPLIPKEKRPKYFSVFKGLPNLTNKFKKKLSKGLKNSIKVLKNVGKMLKPKPKINVGRRKNKPSKKKPLKNGAVPKKKK